MTHFKFQKTFLAVSATAAMAGMLVNGQAHAQVNTEKGSIDVAARLNTSTCVLNLDSTASTAATAASKTVDFGTFSANAVSATGAGTQIGKNSSSIVIALKEANGTAGCSAISTGKWDILIDLPTTAFNDATGTFNNTTTGATASAGISAALFVQVGTSAGSYFFLNRKSPIGALLSGSTTGPNLSSTDTVTVIAQMFRGSNAFTAGAYTARVPLTVVYK